MMTFRLGKTGDSWGSRLAGVAVAVVFVLFWSALTSAADFFSLRDLFGQLATYGYAATDGTITKCEVETRHGSKGGKTHHLHVEYSYSVDNHAYVGDRYRRQSSSQRGDALAIQESYPVDSRRTVYYDPGDPAQAVLLRGLEGRDLFLPLFLTPFNLIMISGWVVIYGLLFPRRGDEETGGVRVRDDGMELRAYVPEMSALIAFALTLFFMCFGMVFVVGFTTGFEPSLNVMIGVWGLIFAVAIWFAAPRFYRSRIGWHDLVIDRFGKRVTLPATHGRQEPRVVMFDAINMSRVKEEKHQGKKGRVSYQYKVLLREIGGEREHCVWQTTNKEDAGQFHQWLRTAIGLEPAVG